MKAVFFFTKGQGKVWDRETDCSERYGLQTAAEKWCFFVYGVCVNIFQTLLNCELSGKERGPNSTLEQKASSFMLCLGYKWHSLTRDRRQRHKLNLAPNHRLLKWRKDISATLLWHREVILFYIVMVRLTPEPRNGRKWISTLQLFQLYPADFSTIRRSFLSHPSFSESATGAWMFWNVHHNEKASISKVCWCDLTLFSVPRKEPSNTDDSFCFFCFSTH